MSVMAKEAATLFLEALGRAQGALEDMRRAYDCMMVQTHASEHVYLSFRTAVEECAQVGDIIHVEHETFGTLQFRVVEVLQETIGKRPLVIWTDRPITRRAYDEPSEKWPFGCKGAMPTRRTVQQAGTFAKKSRWLAAASWTIYRNSKTLPTRGASTKKKPRGRWLLWNVF